MLGQQRRPLVIDIPMLFLFAAGAGMLTGVTASVMLLFIGAVSPVLALAYLPYTLWIAVPVSTIVSLVSLAGGLVVRALATRFRRSAMTVAIGGGVTATLIGTAAALVLSDPIGGFHPAVWTGIVVSAAGGAALALWSLRCARSLEVNVVR